MKKLTALSILVTFVIQIFSLYSVLAVSDTDYDCFIEGENYVSTNWISPNGVVVSDKTCSDEKYISLYTNSTPTTTYYVEYGVYVSEDGIYDIDMAATPTFSDSWSSSIYVQVNGGSEVQLKGLTFETISGNTSIAWQHLNAINLNEGNNTLRFLVKSKAQSNSYTCFIDCFGLKKTNLKVRNITTEAPLNVFQRSENVKLTVNSNATVKTEMQVNWSLSNVDEEVIKTGNTKITAGNHSTDILLEGLDLGYYEFLANGIKTGFSIVKDLAQRDKYEDTPFAIDINFNGSIYNSKPWLAVDYAKVLALSGVSWIRDRTLLKDISTVNDSNYSFSVDRAKRTSDLLKPYGIKITSAADNMPAELLGDYSGYIPDDLVKTYSYWKKLAKQFDGIVDNWELFNEIDLGGNTKSIDGPDMYASFLKAAALGVNDAQCVRPMSVSTQGAASKIDDYSEYIKILMKNDVMKYSSFDNVHEHMLINSNEEKYYQFPGVSDVEGHIVNQNLEGVSAPIWVTEAGIDLTVPNRENFSLANQRTQANYLVTSTIESIASGTDKHFFFIGPSYFEGEKSWGMMSADADYPYMYAALSAQSAMTDILGEGNYNGKLTDLPEGVHGHSFTSNNDTIIVLWTESGEKNMTINYDKVPSGVYDMYGNVVVPSTEVVNKKITTQPCYIKYSGTINGTENSRRPIQEISPLAVTDIEKVIILQKYSDTARGSAKYEGYFINDNDNVVTVDIVNLSSESMNGKICGKFENGWKLNENQKMVQIDPMSKATVQFEIEASEAIPNDYLTFWYEVNGSKSSKSTTKLMCRNDKMLFLEPETNSKFYSTDFQEYNFNTNTGIKIDVQDNEMHEATFDIYVPDSKKYSVWVLGSFISDGTSNCQIAVNGFKSNSKMNSDINAQYYVDEMPMGWIRFEDVSLQKGKNTLSYKVTKIGDELSVKAALDKIVLVESGNTNWIEAENYSKKTGLYYTKTNKDVSNELVTTILTHGVDNATRDNKLQYDFFVDANSNYDIWVLGSQANVDWLTKWKISIDKAEYSKPIIYNNIQVPISEGGQHLYWQCIGEELNLNQGIHTLSILSDEDRAANDGTYMYHIMDAIVITKSNEWQPSNDGIYENKAKYIANNILNNYDLDNVEEHLNLPTKVDNDTTIEWQSNDEDVISSSGIIIRPQSGNVNAILRAIVKCNGTTATKDYNITVKEGNIAPQFAFNFRNLNGDIVTEAKKQTVASVHIDNKSNYPIDTVFYCALFDSEDDSLVDVKVEKNIVEKNTIKDCSVTIEMPTHEYYRYYIRSFLWDENLTPYLDAKTILGGSAILNRPYKVENMLIINGDTDISGEKVNVMVLKKSEKNYNEMTDLELLTNIYYVDDVNTDESGCYSFNVKLPDNVEDYVVRVGGKGFSMVESK